MSIAKAQSLWNRHVHAIIPVPLAKDHCMASRQEDRELWGGFHCASSVSLLNLTVTLTSCVGLHLIGRGMSSPYRTCPGTGAEPCTPGAVSFLGTPGDRKMQVCLLCVASSCHLPSPHLIYTQCMTGDQSPVWSLCDQAHHTHGCPEMQWRRHIPLHQTGRCSVSPSLSGLPAICHLVVLVGAV